jgi:hypothetical protein
MLEIETESGRRRKYITEATALGDKFVFYSAWDHFLLPQNELPASITDKFELNLTITHENLLCDLNRNGVDPATGVAIELSDIDFNIYYF